MPTKMNTTRSAGWRRLLGQVLAAAALTVTWALPWPAPTPAAEGVTTYVGCGLDQSATPSHACDLDHGDSFGAFIRSPTEVTYTVCVLFPTGNELCSREQHAAAGTLNVNRITSNLGGVHLVTWTIDGQQVGSWSFRLPLQPPVFGKSAVLRSVSGKVLIEDSEGGGFVPLAGEINVPMGTVVDTSDGVVALEAASSRGGGVQSGRFRGGLFRIGQKRARSPFSAGRTGMTVLKLTGPLSCGAGSSAGASAAASRGRSQGRRLWGDAHGNFQTGGRYASATVGGTRWLTEDTCAGTRVSVARGVVSVADRRNHRTVLVRAHHSYLAGGASDGKAARGVPVLGQAGYETKGYGHPHPATLSSGGAAVTFYVHDIHWQHWGAPRALGTGVGWYVPPHAKAISDGHEATKKIVAFDLGPCNGRLAYRKLSWFFPAHGGHFDPHVFNELCR
jgi:hypothetical protein